MRDASVVLIHRNALSGPIEHVDKSGLKAAAERGITLGQIGHRIVLENDHVRIWEVRLAPGETIDFHIHYHPYLIVSLGGGANEIETILATRSWFRSR